ncbi:6-pyruvoyl tetrahydropterin synthase family protein [Kitasatospora sp. NPDC056076]|uniref:6-pyruvoyl trahydropterin synthase family protein n=1 Tax=Kitasatospora sp. NPDC056076 TaxID=3345703 RepID=UPI0035E1E850
MATDVLVRHNFETGHRLPHIDSGGKCRNLHGHSWWAEWTITADSTSLAGTVAEFGFVKKALRGWVDATLDHGLMLGKADPLLDAFDGFEQKIFVFGGGDPLAEGLDWPTVENTARLLYRAATVLLCPGQDTPFKVSSVRVNETHVNSAVYRP